MRFRPLAGVLVISGHRQHSREPGAVSVPSRGVGCFGLPGGHECAGGVSVPLRGVGCFTQIKEENNMFIVSVPLRGVGYFGNQRLPPYIYRKHFRPLAGLF